MTRPTHRLVATATAGALAAVTLTGAAGCTNRQSARQKHAEQSTTGRVTVLPDGTQTITVHARDMVFDPSTIIATTGTIVVKVENTGNDPHTFEIPALHVDTHNIPSHQDATVRFTVTTPGSYPFDCAYHVQNGMVGTLQVTAG